MIWYQLLLLNMARGQYLRLGKRPVTDYDHLILNALVWEMEQVRVTE